jgi:hypothetical protein
VLAKPELLVDGVLLVLLVEGFVVLLADPLWLALPDVEFWADIVSLLATLEEPVELLDGVVVLLADGVVELAEPFRLALPDWLFCADAVSLLATLEPVELVEGDVLLADGDELPVVLELGDVADVLFCEED